MHLRFKCTPAGSRNPKEGKFHLPGQLFSKIVLNNRASSRRSPSLLRSVRTKCASYHLLTVGRGDFTKRLIGCQPSTDSFFDLAQNVLSLSNGQVDHELVEWPNYCYGLKKEPVGAGSLPQPVQADFRGKYQLIYFFVACLPKCYLPIRRGVSGRGVDLQKDAPPNLR